MTSIPLYLSTNYFFRSRSICLFKTAVSRMLSSLKKMVPALRASMVQQETEATINHINISCTPELFIDINTNFEPTKRFNQFKSSSLSSRGVELWVGMGI